MSFDSLMFDAVKIYRPQRIPDGQGGFNRNIDPSNPPAPNATTKGRIRPATAREINLGSRWDAVVTHVLYTRLVDIRRDDILDVQGDWFRVQSVREPSKMGHHYEVDCEQIQIMDQGRFT